MKVDTALSVDLRATAPAAVAAERAGHHGLWVGETGHDPFLQMLRAADATARIEIGSAIAVAFARSPMTLAASAYDLAGATEGRCLLGLGSQVRGHIERRFSMPWSRPVARMREYVLALRAIWASWHEGAPLDFRGDFYTHTLMTPYFAPRRHDWGPPTVLLAAVGPRMTEVAGEVADGYLLHPFSTSRYVEEVTLPALLRGRELIGQDDLAGFVVAGPVFVCVGQDEAELAAATAATKAQLAFYASTPAYRSVLELHGWEDLQTELSQLAREGRWDEMGAAIDDEVLRAMAVIGDATTVGAGLRMKYGPFASRVTPTSAVPLEEDEWRQLIEAAA